MQSILTFFIAIAMMSSTTACSLNETPAENKSETPPIKQEQTIEEKQQQAEQKIETPQQQEKKEPIQKVEQPQKTKVEQQPIETKPQSKPKEQPKQQQPVATEDGFISWGTVEMPTLTDGNEGGLENNWDTVGYCYKDGELEEVMQKIADYCDSLGFTYDESLTQFNSSWYPPLATVSESPNKIVSMSKHYADDKAKGIGGTNRYYKVGFSQEEGIEGYFVFLFLG